jgi:hypothetical protein
VLKCPILEVQLESDNANGRIVTQEFETELEGRK